MAVMTKIDMVDEDFLGVATEEAIELVEGTFLEGKPVVAVSAHTGQGLEDLKAALRSESLALRVRKEEGSCGPSGPPRTSRDREISEILSH